MLILVLITFEDGSYWQQKQLENNKFILIYSELGELRFKFKISGPQV